MADTGFDAFFKAVTNSPEFRTVVENDYGKDLDDAIKAMGNTVDKAAKLPSKMMGKFNTPEAVSFGNNVHTEDFVDNNPKAPKNMMMQKDEGEKKQKLEIRYPKDKDSKTFGFKGVAGMDDLKQNLKDSFIAPLKFKFMVEKLEKEVKSPLSQPFPPMEKGVEQKNSKKELYKKLYEVYKKFKVGIPTGMLFYGPPGTGKTFITKKLAEELGAGLIKKSVGEFGSSYMHATTKNIKDFFDGAKEASEKGPIILFLDEIDSLVSKRTNNVDANKAEEVSQFLQEFNALEEAPNLIVIAATNRPDHLDSAILRSGRLDKKIYIGAPDFKARKELFEIYIAKIDRPHNKLDYEELAKLTKDYVAADIEAICDEVSRDASKGLLDLANDIESGSIDHKNIDDKLDNSFITMVLLKQAIIDMPSSLLHVDMSVYENFGMGK